MNIKVAKTLKHLLPRVIKALSIVLTSTILFNAQVSAQEVQLILGSGFIPADLSEGDRPIVGSTISADERTIVVLSRSWPIEGERAFCEDWVILRGNQYVVDNPNLRTCPVTGDGNEIARASGGESMLSHFTVSFVDDPKADNPDPPGMFTLQQDLHALRQAREEQTGRFPTLRQSVSPAVLTERRATQSQPRTNEAIVVPPRLARNSDQLSELKLYWGAEREDNFSTSTAQGARAALASGYRLVRVQGHIHSRPRSGTVPLKLFWSAEREDNFSTSTTEGERAALASGYRLVRVQGHIYSRPRSGTVPLKLFWSAEREDNFSTSTTEGERAALASGYRFVRVQGYVPEKLDD